MEYLSVYGQDGTMLAILDHADKIGYDLKHNDLWTGTFSLPSGDPANEYCQAHNLVKLPDGTRDTGLYRIVSMPSGEESGLQGVKTYNLEHVMATLLDDVLFGYHEVGGTGVYTRQVMQYILDRQTVTRWQLGRVDFNDQFQYHFENVSLLSALLSLGEVLTDEYTWDFDTDTTPWTVNLLRADSAPGCGIHYGRNLVSITKSMDASALITRLYPLGYGEGVNQLNVKEANGGVPYIDASTASVWGIKCSVWTDTRIQDAATLLARARQVLEGYKNPYITYTAKALDLYKVTGFSWDDFMPGKLVHVMDGEHGVDFDARIVEISKRDINGDPGDIEITIANTPRDTADSINTLADRVGIGELYSQGATNLFAIPFADNADESHPAKFRVYIPAGMVRINKMLLSWQLASFRAYSTGAAAGGGTTKTSSSGGGSTQTTTVHDTVVLTSEYGGDTTITQPERTVAPSGTALLGWTGGPYKNGYGDAYYMGSTEGKSLSTDSAGNHSHWVNSHDHSLTSHQHYFSDSDTIYWQHWHELYSSTEYTGSIPADEYSPHSVNIGGNTDSAGGGSTGVRSPGTDSAGSHSHDIAAHSHGMDHFHYFSSLRIPAFEIELPAHTHNVKIAGHNHTVDIPAHTHDITLPDHTHDIVYGIYEGGRASNVTIKVDDETVPASEVGSREIDVSGYLSKDDNGKIKRGTWHEIQIVPDKLTRIEANLTAQVFVQSVGGGDY
jgi:phage minor structural protein